MISTDSSQQYSNDGLPTYFAPHVIKLSESTKIIPTASRNFLEKYCLALILLSRSILLQDQEICLPPSQYWDYDHKQDSTSRSVPDF